MAVKPARVLSLEEAKNMKFGTDIFVDEKSYLIPYAATFNMLAKTPFTEWFNFIKVRENPLDIKDYNKTYRFWNKRPAITTRMKTKWEEEWKSLKDGDEEC